MKRELKWSLRKPRVQTTKWSYWVALSGVLIDSNRKDIWELWLAISFPSRAFQKSKNFKILFHVTNEMSDLSALHPPFLNSCDLCIFMAFRSWPCFPGSSKLKIYRLNQSTEPLACNVRHKMVRTNSVWVAEITVLPWQELGGAERSTFGTSFLTRDITVQFA